MLSDSVSTTSPGLIMKTVSAYPMDEQFNESRVIPEGIFIFPIPAESVSSPFRLARAYIRQNGIPALVSASVILTVISLPPLFVSGKATALHRVIRIN